MAHAKRNYSTMVCGIDKPEAMAKAEEPPLRTTMRSPSPRLVRCALTLILSVAAGAGVCRADGRDADPFEHGPFFIDIGEDAANHVVSRARGVESGATAQRVEAAFGPPTIDQNLVDKKGRFVARELRYYIRKLDRNLVNERHDRYITFYFNKSDQLMRIGYKLSPQLEGPEPAR